MNIGLLRKFTLLLAPAFVLTLASGCANHPVKAAQKAGIRTVQVEPRVSVTAPMRYGFKLGGAGLANALASLIVDSTHTKATKEIGVVMHANGIEVAPIVHDRFLAALRQSNAFVVSDSGADGTFVLSVRQHGFDSPGLKFSTKLPFLVLEGQLLNKDGKRVWRGESVLGHLRTKDIGATWEDYKQHPEKLRADWQAQADSVIEGLMQFQKTP